MGQGACKPSGEAPVRAQVLEALDSREIDLEAWTKWLGQWKESNGRDRPTRTMQLGYWLALGNIGSRQYAKSSSARSLLAMLVNANVPYPAELRACKPTTPEARVGLEHFKAALLQKERGLAYSAAMLKVGFPATLGGAQGTHVDSLQLWTPLLSIIQQTSKPEQALDLLLQSGARVDEWAPCVSCPLPPPHLCRFQSPGEPVPGVLHAITAFHAALHNHHSPKNVDLLLDRCPPGHVFPLLNAFDNSGRGVVSLCINKCLTAMQRCKTPAGRVEIACMWTDTLRRLSRFGLDLGGPVEAGVLGSSRLLEENGDLPPKGVWQVLNDHLDLPGYGDMPGSAPLRLEDVPASLVSDIEHFFTMPPVEAGPAIAAHPEQQLVLWLMKERGGMRLGVSPTLFGAVQAAQGADAARSFPRALDNRSRLESVAALAQELAKLVLPCPRVLRLWRFYGFFLPHGLTHLRWALRRPMMLLRERSKATRL